MQEWKRKEKEGHHSCPLKKRVAHDIRVMAYRTLTSKTIKTIDIE